MAADDVPRVAAMRVNEFDHPFVASSYDEVEGSREDLDLYVSVAGELRARSVLDIGCGTGVLAVRLAEDGYAVTGVDPAGAMLEVAREKPGADTVRWVHGTALDVPVATEDDRVDLAVMTGNVAQVFLTDSDWLATLSAVHTCLTPGGHLVFETRIPERRAWEDWAQWGESTRQIAGVGEVRDSFEVVDVDLPFVSFRSDNRLPDGSIVTAESTLVFRSLDAITQTLAAAGFEFVETRDAPDRPGREWVVIARRL